MDIVRRESLWCAYASNIYTDSIFHPSGKYVAIVTRRRLQLESPRDRNMGVTVWSMEQRKRVAITEEGNMNNLFARFSPDGNYLITMSSHRRTPRRYAMQEILETFAVPE